MASLASISQQKLGYVIACVDATSYVTEYKPIDERLSFGLTVWRDGRRGYRRQRKLGEWVDCLPVEFMGVDTIFLPIWDQIPCDDALKQQMRIVICSSMTIYNWRVDDGRSAFLHCNVSLVDGQVVRKWHYDNSSVPLVGKLAPIGLNAEMYAIPHELFVPLWQWYQDPLPPIEIVPIVIRTDD